MKKIIFIFVIHILILHHNTSAMFQYFKTYIENKKQENIKQNMIKKKQEFNKEFLLQLYLRHFEEVEHLLEKGAEITAKDSSGDTALHYAADQYIHNFYSDFIHEKSLAFASTAIKSGVDVNARNFNRSTAAHFAADRCNLEMLRFLHKN